MAVRDEDLMFLAAREDRGLDILAGVGDRIGVARLLREPAGFPAREFVLRVLPQDDFEPVLARLEQEGRIAPLDRTGGLVDLMHPGADRAGDWQDAFFRGKAFENCVLPRPPSQSVMRVARRLFKYQAEQPQGSGAKLGAQRLDEFVIPRQGGFPTSELTISNDTYNSL